jgi:hypothetical protein
MAMFKKDFNLFLVFFPFDNDWTNELACFYIFLRLGELVSIIMTT